MSCDRLSSINNSIRKKIYHLFITLKLAIWLRKLSIKRIHTCSSGFQASLTDSSLFIFRQGPILIYLFDLCWCYCPYCFWDLHYYLGLYITRTSKGLFLSQSKYAHDLLTKHNMLLSKPTKTPCVPNLRLVPTDGTPLADPHVYRWESKAYRLFLRNYINRLWLYCILFSSFQYITQFYSKFSLYFLFHHFRFPFKLTFL